jgi:hypothetical protein
MISCTALMQAFVDEINGIGFALNIICVQKLCHKCIIQMTALVECTNSALRVFGGECVCWRVVYAKFMYRDESRRFQKRQKTIQSVIWQEKNKQTKACAIASIRHFPIVDTIQGFVQRAFIPFVAFACRCA